MSLLIKKTKIITFSTLYVRNYIVLATCMKQDFF